MRDSLITLAGDFCAGTQTILSCSAGVGILYTTTRRMNCALSLAGCKIH